MVNDGTKTSSDVIMTGNLQYRYTINQIELEGFWIINNDSQKESFSYLFQKNTEKVSCEISKTDIEYLESTTNKTIPANLLQRNSFMLNICSANIFEVILLPHEGIFKALLQYLSGNYHGFFMYFEKTIEDQFYINFILDDDQVRISGKINRIILINIIR